MHFRVTGEWNGEPFDRVIEAEDINDCYNHWMIWAQIAHADVTNIRIEETERTPRRLMAVFYCLICRFDSLFGDSTHATRTTA